jgi:hypothetical protein
MTVGALDEMTRVGLDEQITASPSVRLYAARGEFESFQIAVTAKSGPIKSVSIAISDLRSDSFTINQASITAYREHFVQVIQDSPDFGGPNRPLGPGFYPDALIPVKNQSAKPRFSATAPIDPRHRAVFWVDVFVPRTAQPGQYAGTVTVTSPYQTVTLPISLTVWRHRLPLEPSLKSSFGIYPNNSQALAELMLEHKLMPFLINPTESAYYQNTFGLNATGLPFFSNSSGSACTTDGPPTTAAIQQAMAQYPASVVKYEYAADEITNCSSMFPTVKAWARNVHAAGAKMLVTIAPTPSLFDDGGGQGQSAVDFWVVLPKEYETAGTLIRDALNKGDEVWSYNALVQDTYSPKWEIDFSPINYRIQAGFLSQSLSLTGLLYSEVDSWNADPWTNPVSLSFSGYYFNGEDVLVYPGADAGSPGPVPSMRLKYLRKGVEDFEYVEMLKQAGHGDWALAVIRSVASDWDSWTRSAADLEAVRLRLGAELDELAAQSSSLSGKTRTATVH